MLVLRYKASQDIAEGIKQSIAIGRYGQANEIAEMVAYLVSPAAAYVTGASLKIDGGYLQRVMGNVSPLRFNDRLYVGQVVHSAARR